MATLTPATEAPPWLLRARADLEAGVKEIPGRANSPRIMKMYATVGHPEIQTEETSWCAAAVGTWLAESGFPIPPKASNLMAMAYETYGTRLDEFRPGAICVFYRTELREKDWRRHVAIGVGQTPTHIIVVGGNQGNAVSERQYPKADLVCMRWPVAPTVQELRNAGSTDMQLASEIKRVAVATVGTAVAGAAANQATAPVVPTVMPDITLPEATQAMGLIKTLLEGCHAVAKLVGAHPWLVGGVLGAIALYWLARRMEQNRVKRALLGHPLSAAG